MKRLLMLIAVSLMLAGCVAFPAYDSGYDYSGYDNPGYGPYGYASPNVNLFVSGFHGGHGFRGEGHDFQGGGHGFHGGRHW
jgi:hypothetical protein